MIFKYHTEVSNVKEAVQYYAQLFEGTVIKDGSSGHGNIKLFNQISLLVYEQELERSKVGTHVFKFEDNELELFDRTINRIRNDKSINIDYELQTWSWKTTEVFKFIDKYGYAWAFERNTKAK